MTDTHRPDPKQVARDIHDTLKEKNRLQDELIARLAPLEAAGWTIQPVGVNPSAYTEFGGCETQVDLSESGLELAFIEPVIHRTVHSFICTDADEAIAFVEAVKRALDDHKSDLSVFSGLPESEISITETHRPAPEQVARDISDTLKKKNRFQDEFIARLAPFEAAGWTITVCSAGPSTQATTEVDGDLVEAYHYESDFVLAIRMHSFVCTDADEAISFVEAVKRALDDHKSDSSVFSGLPESEMPMTETDRPDPEQIAREIHDTLKEMKGLEDELSAVLAPFEAAGWTIEPSGSYTRAYTELDECKINAYPSESGFELDFIEPVLHGTVHSFCCTDADEAIAFVEAMKRALDGHRSDPSVFPGLPEPDTTSLRTIRP